jgi:GDSL-like Lipase/Acylhydrolase family
MLLQDSDTSPRTATQTRPRFPRRDYVLLPLLSLLTVGVLFTVTEVVTRLVWSEHEDDVCFINDPVTGFRFKPNCTSRVKNAEGNWTSNSYNDCGYRSPTSCGAKPPGSVRIAILGSSVSQGVFVPYDETFPARVAAALKRDCHKTVDVQNLGVPNTSPIYVYRRLKEALSLKPDIVLFVLTPFDLEQHMDPEQLAHRNDPNPVIEAPAATIQLTPYKRLQKFLTDSRTTYVAQHFLLQNQETFIRLYLLYGDKADFLRQPFTPAWERRFEDLDLIVGDMAKRIQASGSTLLLMPVPSRAEAAMLSYRHPLPRVDAAAFSKRIAQIAERHGAGYVDLMSEFKETPRPEDLFYVVDGHVTSQGYAVIAHGLLEKLMDGSVPPLRACSGGARKG